MHSGSHDLGLGTILRVGGQQRDAIHVAVVPVTAGAELKPGQRIALADDKAVPSTDRATVGIVDPFLQINVPEGDRFWMFLLPNTVTGMRHAWSHPAFPPETSATDPEAEARREIERAASHCGLSVKRMMEAAFNMVEYEEYTYDNTETYKGYDRWNEFWSAWSVLTKRPAPADAYSPFTCSC